jgi:hypothetical protein
MEETQIETPTVKTRRRRYTKSAIVLTVGKTRLPADSFVIKEKFLVVTLGRKQTYFRLEAIDSFSVEHRGKEPIPMAIEIQPSTQREAGGPRAFAEEIAKRRGLEALMGVGTFASEA